MIAKYDLEFIFHPHHSGRVDTYRTDDPVSLEDFVMTLLANSAAIGAIKHEGCELSRAQSDQIISVAAKRLIARLICDSLGLDSAAVKQRFGFAV